MNRQLDLIAVDCQRRLSLLHDVDACRLGHREAATKRDLAALSLALVETHNDAVAVLGTLDRLDDDVRLVGEDQRDERGMASSMGVATPLTAISGSLSA